LPCTKFLEDGYGNELERSADSGDHRKGFATLAVVARNAREDVDGYIVGQASD
jgi:hypothetical protein